VTDDPATDRDRWNAKFLQGEAQSAEPDRLLIEACSALPAGRALDLAGGAGRHALWLAQRGWTVTLADISDEGLALARRRAADAHLTLATRREPAAETLAWAVQTHHCFDLVVVVWCLVRESFAALPSILAPGGLLLYKTYTSDHTRYREGHSLSTALRPGELGAAFPALITVLYRESGGVAELLARSGSPGCGS
jgi:tellurite methyltransferase